ncbi:hypothetical protein JCM1840_003282 [Sporobolomyces johnsonii]
MTVARHFVRNEPLQPIVPLLPPKWMKRKGFARGKVSPGDGLAVDVRYDLKEQESVYCAEEMGWNKNDVPIPRTKSSHDLLSVGAAQDHQGARASSRFDSVVDAYVNMYADSDGREDEEELQPHVQASQPWDERGTTGLYGGGGRGADDHETGWVCGYSVGAVAPPAGAEEDLLLDGLDEDDEGRRRPSSPETAQSCGPVTPESAPVAAQPNPRQKPRSSSSSSRSASLTRRIRNAFPSADSRSTSTRPPLPTPPPLRLSSSARDQASPAAHAARLQKEPPRTAAFPTPSGSLPTSTPLLPPGPSEPMAPRRKSAFEWARRSKKAATISAPILSPGFVEALGINTFALKPGSKPALSAIRSPVLPTPTHRAPAHTEPPRPPLKASPRTRNVPPIRLESPSTRPISPALPTPVRLPVQALRNYKDGDDAASEGYVEDAFRRLSKHSDGSLAPSSRREQSTTATHHQYFDVIRHDHARREEVQANHFVVPANAPTIPPLPLNIGGGFRNPWSSAAPSSRSSSTLSHKASPASFKQYGSARASPSASLALDDPDYHQRSGASSRSEHCLSPTSSLPAPTPHHQQSRREERNDSLSSSYSEDASDPTPTQPHAFVPASSRPGSSTSTSFIPIEPVSLNLSRRASRAYPYPNELGGDVASWQVNEAVRGPSRASSARSAFQPAGMAAPLIGTTGFRNPFG